MAVTALEEGLWDQSDKQAAATRIGTVALHAAYWLAHPDEMRRRFKLGIALPPPQMARVLRLDHSFGSEPCAPTFGRELIAVVAEYFGFTIAEITGAVRQAELIDARSVVVRVLHLRGWSSPQIGRLLNRDHTTILNLLKKFEIYQKRSEDARKCFAQLKHLAVRKERAQ